MKLSQIMLCTLTLTGLCLATLGAGNPAADLPDSALNQLKQLEGRWQGANSKGAEVNATFEVTAGGSAVIERLRIADHPEMVTLYHLDGENLMLTHYCMEGNQPRMRARRIGPGEIEFEFVDATNLASPAAGHMHRALLKFTSTDQFQAAWTWREKGKDAFTEVIRIERTE